MRISRGLLAAVAAILLLFTSIGVVRCCYLDASVKTGVVVGRQHTDSYIYTTVMIVNDVPIVQTHYAPPTWSLEVLGKDRYDRDREIRVYVREEDFGRWAVGDTWSKP